MPRDIHVDTLAELSAAKLSPIVLVELIFDSGPFRVWTGWGELLWGTEWAWTDGTSWSDGTAWTDSGAVIWYGVGNLGFIGAIEETTENRAIGVEVGLSGIPPEVLEIALRENFQNRPFREYLATLNDQGQIVGEPKQTFEGVMDQMVLTEGDKAEILLKGESDEIDFERTNARRYTAEDQRSEHPGDAGFDQVTALQEIEIKLAMN